MNSVIKYIKLPFSFDAEKLQAELNALTEQWVMHFNAAHYEGEWSALPLRSMNGSLSNVIPDNTQGAEVRDTVLMAQCPYMKSIVELFPCEHKTTRLLKLKPGAIIKEHRDADLDFEHGEARIHVPVMTNPQVEFYLDNERLVIKEGECWYMNFNLPHRIANYGATDRVHLVMDIVINDEVRAMFDSVEPEKKKMIAAKPKYSSEEREQMILHLREMNTEVSLRMAAEMEAAGS